MDNSRSAATKHCQGFKNKGFQRICWKPLHLKKSKQQILLHHNFPAAGKFICINVQRVNAGWQAVNGHI